MAAHVYHLIVVSRAEGAHVLSNRLCKEEDPGPRNVFAERNQMNLVVASGFSTLAVDEIGAVEVPLFAVHIGEADVVENRSIAKAAGKVLDGLAISHIVLEGQ